MPMKTMLDTARTPSPDGTRPSVGGVPPGKSPSRSRATMTCPTISAAVRLRTSGMRAGVAEGAVQRAADLARDAQRAAVGLRDIDALDLGALVVRVRRARMRRSHLRVPSADTCSATISGRARSCRSASLPAAAWRCCASRRNRARRGGRSSARAATRASCVRARGRRARRARARVRRGSPLRGARARGPRRRRRGESWAALYHGRRLASNAQIVACAARDLRRAMPPRRRAKAKLRPRSGA